MGYPQMVDKPIPIWPEHQLQTVCQNCSSEETDTGTIFFQGTHILARFSCRSCSMEGYQTLPIGHARYFPVQFEMDGIKSFYDQQSGHWMAAPLIHSMSENEGAMGEFSKIIRNPNPNAVLVNCLDSCFGHVLTKIWNAYTLAESHPQLGLIILLPAQCAWLLPEEYAEAWLVHLPLKAFNKKIEGLDQFVSTEFERFEQISLSNTFIYLNPERYLDLEKVLKTTRFKLSQFTSNPLKITFVLREDRFWHNSRLMDLCYRASLKFGLKSFIQPLLLWRQGRLLRKTGRLILSQLPDADLAAVGLGKNGKLPDSLLDMRVLEISADTEKIWNRRFAESQLVIGVHGSHMMIPTALAAGFINIVPRYKIDQLAEDSLLHHPHRMLQFMGRFLDEFSSPQLLTQHVVSMIRQFPLVHQYVHQQPE